MSLCSVSLCLCVFVPVCASVCVCVCVCVCANPGTKQSPVALCEGGVGGVSEGLEE